MERLLTNKSLKMKWYSHLPYSLFWPKEMKELVAKYEKEGTLNIQAVININRFIKKLFIISFLLSVFWFLVEQYYLLGIGQMLLLISFIYIGILETFRYNMAAYIHGTVKNATVESSASSFFGRHTVTVYLDKKSESSSSKRLMMSGNISSNRKIKTYEPKTTIRIFDLVDKSNNLFKYKSMPAEPKLIQAYSLTTAHLKGEIL